MKQAVQGFTLVEVLVALLIFAVTSAAIVKGTAVPLKAQERLEQKTLASWIASNELVMLSVEEQLPPAGVVKKEVNFADRQWRVTRTVKIPAEKRLREVTMDVAFLAGGGLNEVPVFSLIGFMGEP